MSSETKRYPFGLELPAHTPDHDIPTFSGKEKWRELFGKWGVPNSAPRQGESHFGRSRVLFRDDWDDGRPVAYWVPDELQEASGGVAQQPRRIDRKAILIKMVGSIAAGIALGVALVIRWSNPR